MNYELIEVLTEQNIKLSGYLLSQNNKKCIFFIPGLLGNFSETAFTRKIAKECIKKGYDFLFSHNQSSFEFIDNTFLKTGAAYEKFENSIYDIKSWINFLKEKNYEEIIVIAHSLGCNKIIYYLNENNEKLITKIILLSPQDNVNFDKLDMHKGMFKEAKNNIDAGLNDKILTKKLLGFCKISSVTYYQLLTNKVINNIPYKNKNGDFKLYKNISIPIYIIIGSIDIGSNGHIYMKNVLDNSSNTNYKILYGANHDFKDKEKELTDLILEYLK